jgi:ElaB/YqjD/DUF883 family membrane-anchored ribosome-binding protein
MANESTATSAAKQGSRSTASEVESLQEQIEALKNDITAISTTLTGLVKTGVREGRARAERTAENYKQQGMQQAEAAMEGARAYGEALEGHIERNPFSAVLVALGLGFLIGLMSRR